MFIANFSAMYYVRNYNVSVVKMGNVENKLVESRSNGQALFHVMNVQPDRGKNVAGYLTVSAEGVTFECVDKRRTITWKWSQIRKYGHEDDMFKLEAGKMHEEGEGQYLFRCKDTPTIFYLAEFFSNGSQSEPKARE